MYIAFQICALVFNIYVLSFSDSTYIGLPERSWTDASAACSLQSKEKIESGERIHYTSTYIKDINKMWIGTYVKYSKWAAFIGCGNGFTTETPTNSSSTKAALKECLMYCSDNPSFSYVSVQNSECRCLSEIISVKKGNNCRRKCDTINESLCGSGHSAMLFTFVNDSIGNSPETFIGDECAYINPANSTYNAASCEREFRFSCKNSSGYLKITHWDGYQERCIEEGEPVVYGRSYSGHNPLSEPYWTPIFRVHKTYNDGFPSDKSVCLTWLLNQGNSEDYNSTKFVREENCSRRHPFLCVRSGKKPVINGEPSRSPREITISIYIVIAAGILFLLLISVIIGLCSKLSQRKTTQEINPVIDLELADGFPESLQLADESIRVRETYIEAGDAPVKSGISNYNQVYDDVTKGFFIK